MRLVLSLMILLFILGSCGKKSDPEYQGSRNNFITTIQL
jgi:hypothetical protein